MKKTLESAKGNLSFFADDIETLENSFQISKANDEMEDTIANIRYHLHELENELKRIEFEMFKKTFQISKGNDGLKKACTNMQRHLRNIESETKQIENNI